MTSANSHNEDCQNGICEINFKPVKAKCSLQDLKSLASELIDKVKGTLSSDSHDAIESETLDRAGEKNRLNKMLTTTTRENRLSDTSVEGHMSMHQADILDRFVQANALPASGAHEPLKMAHVRPRAVEGQLKSGRFDNPWRYDNRH